LDELDALREAQSIQSRLDGGLELITRYRGRASRNLVGVVVRERAPGAARTLEACGPRRVYVSGSMRLPLWFATGRELPDVRQWTLSLDQHGQEWQTSPATDGNRTRMTSLEVRSPGLLAGLRQQMAQRIASECS
jgi:hypothetical protein